MSSSVLSLSSIQFDSFVNGSDSNGSVLEKINSFLMLEEIVKANRCDVQKPNQGAEFELEFEKDCKAEFEEILLNDENVQSSSSNLFKRAQDVFRRFFS